MQLQENIIVDPRTVKNFYEGKTEIKARKKTCEKGLYGFEELIQELYFDLNVTAKEIMKVLQEKYDYQGSYSPVKAFIHKLKEEVA